MSKKDDGLNEQPATARKFLRKADGIIELSLPKIGLGLKLQNYQKQGDMVLCPTEIIGQSSSTIDIMKRSLSVHYLEGAIRKENQILLKNAPRPP